MPRPNISLAQLNHLIGECQLDSAEESFAEYAGRASQIDHLVDNHASRERMFKRRDTSHLERGAQIH